MALQHLRAVYAANDERTARQALIRFYTWVADHDQVPELVTLAAWQDQILAYHRSGHASNGPTEAVYLLIEKVRRISHGFRNFDNYRLRLLLTCGLRWNTTRRTTPRPQTTPQRMEPLYGGGKQAELEFREAVLKSEHRNLAACLLVALTSERAKVSFEALVKHTQARSAASGAYGLHGVSSRECS